MFRVKKLYATVVMGFLVVGLCACNTSTSGSSNAKNSATSQKQGNPSLTTTTVPDASATIDAKAIVQANCAACHGANLQGAQGPTLIGLSPEFTKAQIADIIKNGKQDSQGSMHAGVLTDPKQIDAVAEYLVNLK